MDDSEGKTYFLYEENYFTDVFCVILFQYRLGFFFFY